MLFYLIAREEEEAICGVSDDIDVCTHLNKKFPLSPTRVDPFVTKDGRKTRESLTTNDIQIEITIQSYHVN